MKNEKSEALVNFLIFVIVAVVAAVWWDRFRVPVTFVVTLGILVAIHEWGHFIAAKSVGVHVYEFALGFGPKLMTYMRRGGTEYTIRAVPLGGFVNPKGMQPDDPITSDGLNGRRPAERALVYLAGPLMNVILGVVVLMLSGWLFGVADESKVLVGDVVRKSEATRMEVVSRNGQPAGNAKPGLRVGDYILEANGKPITSREMVTGEIHRSAGQPVTLRVRRGEETLTLRGVPESKTIEDDFLVVTSVPEGTRLAVQAGDQIDRINGKFPFNPDEKPDVAARKMLSDLSGQPVTLTVWRNGTTRVDVSGIGGPLELAIKPGKRTLGILGFTPYFGQGPRIGLAESARIGLQNSQNILLSLVAMFSQPKQLKESVGGPIAIWVLLGTVGSLPLFYYFMILAQLSLSLAVFNLLPIPVLDGGHMLLLTIEVLRRKRLEPEMQKVAALCGLAVLGVIFVLIMGKDIIRNFG